MYVKSYNVAVYLVCNSMIIIYFEKKNLVMFCYPCYLYYHEFNYYSYVNYLNELR